MTIGIVPCAGTASRIRGLPKYLLPLPDGYLLQILLDRIAVVAPYSLVGTGWHNNVLIREYITDRDIAYYADAHDTMTQTILSSEQGSETVYFGMPDVWFEDDTVYPKLAAALADGADVAVALFYARPEQHKKVGMCTVDGNQVIEVVDKPTTIPFTHLLWGALAWQPVFWQHMRPEDPHVGYSLPRAIAAGLDVRAVKCDGQYFDCGDYAGYEELVLHLHGRKEPNEMVARL